MEGIINKVISLEKTSNKKFEALKKKQEKELIEFKESLILDYEKQLQKYENKLIISDKKKTDTLITKLKADLDNYKKTVEVQKKNSIKKIPVVAEKILLKLLD